MKIYLASSWKNSEDVISLQHLLETAGHEVDAFCNMKGGRYVFSFKELGDISGLNNINIRNSSKVDKAFKEDKKWLDWCDCCIMLLPCGKSAHLEAGYAKGQGKKLIIYNHDGFENGEVDVMYGFANLITDSWETVHNYLKKGATI